MSWLTDSRVAVTRDLPRYPTRAPFHPSEPYPEWPDRPVGDEDNPSYRAVRRCLLELGLDAAHAGTPAWNPLGEIVRPGEKVVIKPNLVAHRNTGERSYGLTDTDSLVTHGSVIRATLDYVARALDGRGRIVIGDCPAAGAAAHVSRASIPPAVAAIRLIPRAPPVARACRRRTRTRVPGRGATGKSSGAHAGSTGARRRQDR